MEKEESLQNLNSLLDNLTIESDEKDKTTKYSNSANSLQCPICIQAPNYPVKLDPCGHIFCFLCIKGVCLRASRCPMCRTQISRDIAFNGISENQLLTTVVAKEVPKQPTDVFWYYEGYKGWWEYDSVTGSGIEEAFQTGEQKISVYLFGFKYTINLNKMQQCSEGSTNRIRKIRRSEGQMTDHKKGVAGIFSTNSKE